MRIPFPEFSFSWQNRSTMIRPLDLRKRGVNWSALNFLWVDRSLPASCIAHEVLCLASICRSYLTKLVFANRFFDRNVFCPPVDCQLYFTHSYFACGTLPVITLPICILPAEGKTLECEVHTGKIRWAKYDWQNTHGQSTRW